MKKSNNLLLQIIIAIVSGITIGHFINEGLLRLFLTFNGIFSEFLGFCIPLIIIGLIIPSIGKLGHTASNMVIVVTILAYISTILSAYTSYGVSILTFPHLLEGQFLNSVNEIENIKPYFSLKFPPIIDVMSALLLAFIMGIGISKIQTSYILIVC